MHFDLKKVILCCLCCLFINVVDVYAEVCESAEVKRLKVLAEQIEINYEYVENLENNEFKYYLVYLDNVDDDFVVIVDDYLYYNPQNMKLSFESYNRIVNLSIYSSSCDIDVKKIKYEMPWYNTYADLEVCEKLEKYNLDVCEKWYYGTIDSEYFNEVISQYQKELDDGRSIFEDDLSFGFYFREYFYLFVIAFFVIAIIIFSIIKHVRRRVLK